ncbi:Splicing factor 3B subunit 2 [Picochlorum sp. SENEW3]|nr:Splicing factor 3B subunit 2 [Picochlorum sp. SENEW3]WPT15709.1 Splicing factor 3B subunit 2 [Picochlorum sp. SENEW3]
MVRATRSRRAASKKADKDNDSPAEKPATRRGRRSNIEQTETKGGGSRGKGRNASRAGSKKDSSSLPTKVQPQSSGNEKLTMAQKKNRKKKLRKAAKRVEREQGCILFSGGRDAGDSIRNDFEVEYVAPPTEMVLDTLKVKDENGIERKEDPAVLEEFAKILQRFGNPESSSVPEEERAHHGSRSGDEGQGNDVGHQDTEGELRGSRKQKRGMKRMTIGELKQACLVPEIVEVWDVTAMDPLMLVYLKAYRNTVPVPRHWSQKRKYLQGKRGLEKPPFKLPAFIAATGIGEMRQAYLEKAEEQNMKSRGRERTQPKMGKLDIDYRVLYDAFFRHQQKPLLSNPGELYYEGKEFETAHLKKFRPGVLSDSLSEALGVQRGAPPPWLVAMQRYGPPPSYTSLRIPGLNAPIPPNAQFGYHPGGWGKPPVDEFGNPIYGDVFGEQVDDDEEEDIHVIHWGEADEEEEEEEEEEEVSESDEDAEEEEEEEEEEEDKAHVAGDEAEQIAGHISGLETPAEVQIRKEDTSDRQQKQLYQVLEQKKVDMTSTGIMGSDHVYNVPSKKSLSGVAAKRLEALRRGIPEDYEISIDPADLESLDDASLKELYDAKVAEHKASSGTQDFSDLVAARAASDKKRKAGNASNSKDKKFKF